ncbi:UDP-N-acetylmuramoyl-L-alanyl-D-glutamate--2,6-diaminopimelate ligase [Occultella glacieicola]|uniref:UDP-N-acetylmuramyl-tripeptide synthetase n=1 Tax=Occultella glacieicola TaxID=2518684 RepID=A0ABY2E074_9MICO|nr:UDP-N-acetylmuramoyl-L-alanyl-D-glutamate--2,6-diaminopimelate ligase [Occultella glacieicola]TDE90816.1 UDP-N-acetylmuramoyl-L-alanyl-D-glutamate--2,6-diaminopimelate ligase [Occultella glacieicola]
MSTTGEAGRPRTLAALADAFGLTLPATSDAAGITLTGVSLDNRTTADGYLFAALPGARVHGAAFVAPAVEAGAVAVLTDAAGAALIADGAEVARTRVPVLVADDPRLILGDVSAWVHHEPAEKVRTFGVTGTNGKTTTTYLLEEILSSLGGRTGLIGTVELKVGPDRTPARLTTPEAPQLHALLTEMVAADVDAVIMEVSSHALALHRVDGVVFDVVAFTNLTEDHLDFHGGIDHYFATKASLFTPAHARRGVVLVDDAWGRRLAEQAGIDIVTVGTGAAGRDADWMIVINHTAADHTDFTITHSSGRSLSTTVHLPGRFNVANAAVALVMAIESGTTPAELNHALPHGLRAVVPGRMELVANRPRCIVDFAHNADALRLALAALRPSTKGRLFVVFGATGERDRGKRAVMGRVAVEHADVVVITDDDPHDEEASAIRAEVMAGALRALPAAQRTGRAVDLFEVAPRRTAIHRAIRFAGPADTVLIAGRGHETLQEIAGVEYHLDDREEVRTAMSERSPQRTEEP